MSMPSMPGQSLPPKIPTRSLAPVVFGLVGFVVALGGGVWLLSRPSAEEETPAPEAPAAQAKPAPSSPPVPAAAAAEPPPPPPPDVESAPRSAKPPNMGAQIAPAKVEAPKVASARRDPGCEEPCRGREPPELLTALSAKARQARSCYERALSNNSALSGRIEVAMRVSSNGTTCAVSASKNTLGDSGVTNCVLQRFRTGSYPKPAGGCVNIAVPINFMPAGTR
jgi:type IV secretory pathway VirB10-like protein